MDMNFKTIFLWHMVSGLEKPGPRAAKPITPPYVESNYRIEVKIIFMLIAYLVLLCKFFWEFSIFHFCRPLVDIYWHPLLSMIPGERHNEDEIHLKALPEQIFVEFVQIEKRRTTKEQLYSDPALILNVLAKY